MSALFVSLVSGLLLTQAFPPRDWGWLVFPAVTGLLWSVRRRGFSAGLVFGLAFFGTLFPWLAELGLIALLPLLVLEALFVGVFAAGLYRWRDLPGQAWWMAATGGWSLMEFLRERFPLGGFPWGVVGYPLGDYRLARYAAQWIGASGWSVVVVMVAAGTVLALEGRTRRPLGVGLGLMVLLATAGAVSNPAPTGETVKVTVVQGSEPCLGYHCPGERRDIYQRHLDLTRLLEPGSAQLVVWPEGSTGFNADPVLDPEVGADIGAEARRLGAWMLVGGDRPISDTNWVNANVIFDPSGEMVGEYQKRHGVPFGEFIPARAIFGRIPALAAVPRDMIPGDGPKVFDMGFSRVGSVISFEGSFARYGRETVAEGAQILVVATSQASYPRSVASDQFLAMSRMRTGELGVDIVHASVTGKSAIIVNGGEFAAITSLAEPDVISAEVRPRTTPPTLYTRWGDWVQMIAFGGLAWVWKHSR